MTQAAQSQPKKIVLAYSGGLDTSVILPWLKERYPGVKLVAFAAELGQGDEPDIRNTEAHIGDAGAGHIDGRKAVRGDHTREQCVRRSGQDRGGAGCEQSLEACRGSRHVRSGSARPAAAR